MPVSTIMTKDIVAINRTDDLEYAETLFKKHHIRHLPVTSKGVVVGILSYSDLLRISFADSDEDDDNVVDSTVYNLFSIDQVMTKQVITIRSDTPLKEAAQLMIVHNFHALPIVDNTALVGIVTTTDLMSYLIKQL